MRFPRGAKGERRPPRNDHGDRSLHCVLLSRFRGFRAPPFGDCRCTGQKRAPHPARVGGGPLLTRSIARMTAPRRNAHARLVRRSGRRARLRAAISRAQARRNHRASAPLPSWIAPGAGAQSRQTALRALSSSRRRIYFGCNRRYWMRLRLSQRGPEPLPHS